MTIETINNDENWKARLIAQLQHYKKKSPFYKQAIEVVQKGLDIETDSIVKLNYSTLNAVCEYLEIPFDCEIFSEMNVEIEPVNAPDEWALNICKALEYSEYWNPPGGLEFFDHTKYEKAGIDLKFQKVNVQPYSQRRGPENIEAGLSIIDVMMFNSPEKIHEMLDDFTLVGGGKLAPRLDFIHVTNNKLINLSRYSSHLEYLLCA